MKITRREFLKTSLIGITSIPLITAGYGFGIEPSWLEITHTTVPIPGLQPPFEGFRIAHISDIHVDTDFSEFRLQQVVKMVNDLDVDLIIHTGDYVRINRMMNYWVRVFSRGLIKQFRTSDPEAMFEAAFPALASMKSKYGAYAVLGNHDHWAGADLARKYMQKYGLRLLENTSALVTVDNASINIAGVGDLLEGEQDLAAAFNGTPPSTEAPRIVLSHNPDFADDSVVGEMDTALMLSGHTHGGQVTIPGYGPPVLPIRNRRYAKGLVDTNWGWIYISRGIGCTFPPIRINTRPEIAVIELTAG